MKLQPFIMLSMIWATLFHVTGAARVIVALAEGEGVARVFARRLLQGDGDSPLAAVALGLGGGDLTAIAHWSRQLGAATKGGLPFVTGDLSPGMIAYLQQYDLVSGVYHDVTLRLSPSLRDDVPAAAAGGGAVGAAAAAEAAAAARAAGGTSARGQPRQAAA
jgi:hypothetical protein